MLCQRVKLSNRPHKVPGICIIFNQYQIYISPTTTSFQNLFPGNKNYCDILFSFTLMANYQMNTRVINSKILPEHFSEKTRSLEKFFYFRWEKFQLQTNIEKHLFG